MEQKAKELYEAHCARVPGPPSPPWSFAPEWVKRKFRREAEAASRTKPPDMSKED